MEPFTEQALLLGPANSLVGVITLPDTAIRRTDAPLVVILNAGIIHRVGPNRMSVTLSRALAAEGFGVLRFDLSSLGDSAPRRDELPLLDVAMADIRDVINTLETAQRVERVVLVGLCSGADHSVIYAGADPRIVGTVLLDPSLPRTRGYYLRHFGSRILHSRPWLKLAASGPARWRAIGQGVSRALGADGNESQVPLMERPEVRLFLERAYARALTHGVQMLAVFTGGLQHRHNHSRQLLEAFPKVNFGEQLRLEYFGESDHTFSTDASRRRLTQLVVAWARTTQFTARGTETRAG